MSEEKKAWAVIAKWVATVTHEPIGFVVQFNEEAHARALAECLTHSVRPLEILLISSTEEVIGAVKGQG